MSANHYQFWQSGGYTSIFGDGRQVDFRGVSVGDLSARMIEIGDRMRRDKQHLRALHAVVQSLDAAAVCYVSVDTVESNPAALKGGAVA